MKIALLGNGFDLHHSLPTRYIDILHLFSFWASNHDKLYKTAGEVLNDYISQENMDIYDSFFTFYKNYKKTLNFVSIDENEAKKLIYELKHSFWFNYFSNAKNVNINWIDFEKEISMIIDVFDYIIKNSPAEHEKINYKDCPRFSLCLWHDLDNPCISIFEDPTEELNCLVVHIDSIFKNTNSYSSNKTYNVEKITEYLYNQLDIIKKAIVFYLKIFINSVTSEIKKSKSLSFLDDCRLIVSLNYSNTFEKIYYTPNDKMVMCHYHGDASKNSIVLGIDSSTNDEFSTNTSPDTTFLVFKKYYQRILQNCDYEFSVVRRNMKSADALYNGNLPGYREYLLNNPDTLYVVGHSLDSTDRDIIVELFEFCKYVFVYYYQISDFGKYIQNLIKIFGKSKFEEMRNNGKIQFKKLNPYIV